jgi:hypothetical protein
MKVKLGQSTYLSCRTPDVRLTLNGWNVTFVNHIKALCVIFDSRITWMLHREIIESEALTITRVYSLFRSERLRANMKLTLHKALIRSIITYSCSTWEFAADAHILKLQLFQDEVLHTIGKFPICTPILELYMAFQVPHVYDYVTKLCTQRAEVS